MYYIWCVTCVVLADLLSEADVARFGKLDALYEKTWLHRPDLHVLGQDGHDVGGVVNCQQYKDTAMSTSAYLTRDESGLRQKERKFMLMLIN